MLRKLMKYELKATARLMIPLYIAVLALALALRLLAVWSNAVSYEGILAVDPVEVLLVVVTVAFFLAVVGTPIAAVVLTIVRFKTNLLSDEGYVMFSLPVSTHKLVWSKLLTSAVWFIGAGLVDLAGVLILAADQAMFSGLLKGIGDLFSDLTAYYAANGALVIVELILAALVLCFNVCLEFYCPMAIGHSFARHKVLLSVVFYFVLEAVRQTLGVILVTLGLPFLEDLDSLLSTLDPAVSVHGTLWGIILVGVIYGGLLYAITIRMLRRHLNLE